MFYIEDKPEGGRLQAKSLKEGDTVKLVSGGEKKTGIMCKATMKGSMDMIDDMKVGEHGMQLVRKQM